jgi:hypothetical protein
MANLQWRARVCQARKLTLMSIAIEMFDATGVE